MTTYQTRAATIAALEARATAIAAVLTTLDRQPWAIEPNPEHHEESTIRAASGDGLRIQQATHGRLEIVSTHPDRALYQYTFHDDAYTTRITVSASRTDQAIAGDIQRRLLPDARAQRAALTARKAAADERTQRHQATIQRLASVIRSQPYGHDKHCFSLPYRPAGISGSLRVDTDSSIQVELRNLTADQAEQLIQLIQQLNAS